jgi:hypothetical protein
LEPVANEGEPTTSYYVNDLTHSQSQGGVTNVYNLDFEAASDFLA